MAEALDRLLSPGERVKKAKVLLEEGLQDFDVALKAEEELGIRRRAAVACEAAFHAFVELCNAVIQAAGRPVPDDHDARIEELEEIGREDLAHWYGDFKDALHTAGYYSQRLGRRQEARLRQLADVLREEIRKLDGG